MSDHASKYVSYLLRLWRVDDDGCQTWRASLEDPRTGERRGFNNLDGLLEFLKSQPEKGQERQSAEDSYASS